MRQWRLSDQQVLGFLQQVARGAPVRDLGSKHGFTDARYCTWRSRLGGLDVSQARRLCEFDSENTRLKKRLAEAMLDIEPLKVLAQGKRCCSASGAPVADGKHCVVGR